MLSKGPTETGGFYNFGGGWTKQENRGVNWLTNYKSMDENAVRLKVTKLSNGQILVLYEMWTGTQFISGNLMTLDHNGKVTRAPRSTKFPFRMPWGDEIVSTGSNTAVLYAASAGKLVRYEVSLPSGPGSGTGSKAVTKAPITTTVATKAPTHTKDLGPVQRV